MPISYSPEQSTTLSPFGDSLIQENLVPGGMMLKQGTLTDNYVKSGTIVSRRASGGRYVVVGSGATLTSKMTTKLKVAGLATDTVITVFDPDSLVAGDVISIGTVSKTIAADGVNLATGQITLTSALATAQPVNSVVELGTAVALLDSDLAVLAYDVRDASKDPSSTLYRPLRILYIDRLTQLISAETLVKLKAKYQCMNSR